MKVVLLIDFGSTYTKVTAVDFDEEVIIGSARAFTTIETDINDGLEGAIAQLKKKYGHMDIHEMFACSSAAGGLRMIAIGLVPDLTAEAAKRAALSAGAKVMNVFSYELNEQERKEIDALKPDIILLTGGTDGGNKDVILHNAKVVAELQSNAPVIVAGNKSVQEQVMDILKEKEVTLCENVMPELDVLNITSARLAIRDVFLRKIVYAKGLSRVQELIQGILMPTPSAVLKAAKTLSLGTKNQKGWGDLIVVDVGGATTDIHSIAEGLPSKGGVLLKGLQEPLVKRTVEGDLGVRYSAHALIETCGIQDMEKITGLSKERIITYLDKIKHNPEYYSDEDDDFKTFDFGLASLAVRDAVHRHVGRLETHYTPFGATYLQTGKDLTELRKIIGTGGSIIHCDCIQKVLEQALFDPTDPTVLRPMQSDYYIDHKYILAAMGLLAEHYPDKALNIMKKEIKLISRGE
ncbi:glutamate mutase L [Vallitalea pronyensis]|uniref:Glutamate mutase L n=1 Tax=Vallitalea pronyensis TaxID=1348613 RepID=A0A8J8SGQ2_9FIRM|nr:methylaspartate mutase accessory protein GlmL [Vallitalea pronyensis]QUI22602.1 glutamate mutase L [Vallitalea pronyensis]